MTSQTADTARPSAAALFAGLCDRFDGGAPSVGDVMRHAGPNSAAVLVLIFALPEAVPLPVAGLSTILALPLIGISLQMLIHGAEPRLPAWLDQRRVPIAVLRAGAQRLAQVLGKLDRITRPRWHSVVQQHRLIGLVCLVLALVLALPIPFGNMLPALCLVGVAVGVLQRDGMVVVLAALAGLCVTAGFSAAILAAIRALQTGIGG